MYDTLYSLKLLNTFSINAHAKCVLTVHNAQDLLKFWKQNYDAGRSVLILGAGSNVLFLENYIGTILLNRIKGIIITESTLFWSLHIGAGENWNKLVVYTLKKNIPGLENLAGIPGYVGAALIHNIGAYGVELSQICEYVDVLELNTGKKIRFTSYDCNFQYRGSIFSNYLNKYAILFVGLRLKKKWKPELNYDSLMRLNASKVTPYQIFNYVSVMRRKSLPDPKFVGNAGSFFKNPIVDTATAYRLLKIYPNIPHYYQLNGKIKFSAGWLIEHCKLKGYVFGEASVCSKHALILINNKKIAMGTEIAALALYIHSQVVNKFNICLVPEVRFIGSRGEIDPDMLFT